MKSPKKITIGILILMTLIIALSSCCKKVLPVQNKVIDSIKVETKVIERDTVIVTDTAFVSVAAPVKELKPGMKPITKKSKQAKVTISVNKQGKLIADCECDTTKILAQLKDTYQQSVQTKVITQNQKEKYIPWLVKVLAYIGGGFVFLTILYYIIKIIKP